MGATHRSHEKLRLGELPSVSALDAQKAAVFQNRVGDRREMALVGRIDGPAGVVIGNMRRNLRARVDDHGESQPQVLYRVRRIVEPAQHLGGASATPTLARKQWAIRS